MRLRRITEHGLGALILASSLGCALTPTSERLGVVQGQAAAPAPDHVYTPSQMAPTAPPSAPTGGHRTLFASSAARRLRSIASCSTG
jgi:hypothetical protein